MNSERDPVQCSLFYMALRKKTVLLGLWKLANGHPEQSAMMRFMANDFSDDRWKKAALKNAYALLGKQRFGKPTPQPTLHFLLMKYCCNFIIRICCGLFPFG